ncbi:putative membrane protein [Hahella chejuensis KCTC 2396]|uniref:Putative membrane protein n=2 Tax=Hahella chejuensis TaxID=158327 RepID=Q2SJH3_HAHCH|nr:putative membrane protein [Hahella chejuensis KCTC 2396]
MFALASIKIIKPYLSTLSSGYVLMFVTMLAQLVTIPLYLGSYEKWGFGVISMMLAVVPLMALGITWVSGGGMRLMGEAVAKNDIVGARRIYSASKYLFTLYGVVVAFILAAIGISFQDYWIDDAPNYYTREDLHYLIISFCVYIVVQYEFSSELAAFAATKKQHEGNIIQIINPIVMAAAVYVMILFGVGIQSVFISMTLGYLVMRVCTHYYWRRVSTYGNYVVLLSPDREQIEATADMLKDYAVSYSIYGVLLLFLFSDVIIVGYLMGAEAAATLALIWKIPNLLMQTLWRVPIYAEPYVIHMDAKGEMEKLRSLFKKGFFAYSLMCFIAASVFYIIGEDVLQLWVGNIPDLKGDFKFLMCAGAIFFLSLSRWPISFLYAMVKLRMLIKVMAVELLVKVFFVIFFYNYHGFISPIVAINVEYILGLALAYYFIIKRERLA